MINLKEAHYISEGLARKVYYHPENQNLCIKIGKPEIEENHLYKEIKYYKRISHKNASKFEYQFYSNYYGEVDTNLGIGFVYDLIKDETSHNISLTLRHYLEMKNAPISDETLLSELSRLKNQMIKNKIFVADLKSRNICCKLYENGTVRMIIVDGLGHRDFFPFGDYSSYFAQKKVERRFKKAHLNSLEEQRAYIKRLRDRGDLIV